MRKIHLVTSGEYSSYYFVCAFESHDDAQAFADREGGEFHEYRVEQLYIYEPGQKPQQITYWLAEMNTRETEPRAWQVTSSDFSADLPDSDEPVSDTGDTAYYFVRVRGRNREAAIKGCYEAMAVLKAREEGIA